ncbi:MAG: hypothetical protein ACLP9L_33165 [Thermoguttaceae bacterium]
MKKSILPAIGLSVSILAFLLLSPSGACAQHSHNTGRTNNPNDKYLVIKITDESKVENKVEYKVITTSQFKDEEKRVKDEYNKKMKEWRDLKKIDPQTPQPLRPVIKKIAKIFETQKIAQEYAEKLKDEDANNGDAKPQDARK